MGKLKNCEDNALLFLTFLRLRKLIMGLVLYLVWEIALVDLGELKEKKGNTSVYFSNSTIYKSVST